MPRTAGSLSGNCAQASGLQHALPPEAAGESKLFLQLLPSGESFTLQQPRGSTGTHSKYTCHGHATAESQDQLAWKSLRDHQVQPLTQQPCLAPMALGTTSSLSSNTSRHGDCRLLGQPVPASNRSIREEILPNVQSQPLMAQLKATSSHPITRCVGEEAEAQLAKSPARCLQRLIRSPLSPLFFWLNNSRSFGRFLQDLGS